MIDEDRKQQIAVLQCAAVWLCQQRQLKRGLDQSLARWKIAAG